MLTQWWLRVLLIISLGLSAYSFMLASPFKTMDDQYSIVANPLIRNNKHIKEIFTRGYFNDHSYYRPLVNLSFMGEYQLFGLNPFFYNLDNLLLHILNAFLVWALAGLIMANFTLGFWAGLLFVLHPIHVEAVANISGRAILLGASFVLTAFICFLLYDRRAQAGFWWLSIASFSVALLCKESAAILPGVIFFYLWLNKRPLKGLWPLAVAVVFYLLLRHSLGITQMFSWRNATEHILGLVTFLRSVMSDLRLFLFPVDLHFDRSQPLFLSFSDAGFLTTVFGWIIAMVWMVLSRRHITTLVWFCLAWFALELFPVSQMITTIGVSPGVISSADHFLYLASLPVFILLIKALGRLGQVNQQRKWISSAIFKTAVGGFIVFLFLINIEQNIYASSELSMMERSLQIQPRNARLQASVGLIYALNGKPVKAEEHFRWAVAADPFSPRYRISLGKSICDQGRYQECLNVYNQIQDASGFEALLRDNKRAALRLSSGQALRLIKEHVQILSK
ncbi:MAG: glycosyltransferase family 39 protein [Candidatus Omnitrophica bacterium]|nr:glycosyltransferase family 39 protein [Candidatus Omnitrophota bacterium]